MRATRQAFVLGLLLAMSFGAPAKAVDYQLDELVDGLDTPWSLAFLPNGDLLVTELPGRLRVIRNGKLVAAPVQGVPESLYGGQGGLMDVVLHPEFKTNQMVYLSFSVGTSQASALRVVRGRFTGTALEDVSTVFEAAPKKNGLVHYGARMAFMPDKSLLITVGDGFDLREQAQNTGNHFGSIVRVTDNGKVPSDNPFATDEQAQPEIYSYGHRNPQSIIYDAPSRTIYATEHGPRGGDELNLIQPGQNYGWPIASYGIDYSGARITPYTEYEGTTQPLHQWTPSIAASGMSLYRGSQFEDWQGDIFVTSLVFNYAVRVDMDGAKVQGTQTMFAEIGARLRDIRSGPDGALYILSEGENGKIWRVSKP
jgi:glucose/arabinose dehydrogenase